MPPKFIVSRSAQNDLRAIARYTTEQWGAEQAKKYAAGLQTCFQTLAENPRMGRTCDWIGNGLHRHELGRHVIFYRLAPAGIRVVRILHRQMIPDPSRFKE